MDLGSGAMKAWFFGGWLCCFQTKLFLHYRYKLLFGLRFPRRADLRFTALGRPGPKEMDAQKGRLDLETKSFVCQLAKWVKNTRYPKKPTLVEGKIDPFTCGPRLDWHLFDP